LKKKLTKSLDTICEPIRNHTFYSHH